MIGGNYNLSTILFLNIEILINLHRLFEIKEPIKEPYFQDKIKLAVSAVDESLPPRQVIIKSYRRLNNSIGKLESSEFDASVLSDSNLTLSERKGNKNKNIYIFAPDNYYQIFALLNYN